MIDVVKIIKERGAGRYGTCANCGIGSRDTSDLIRIRVTNLGCGNTFVLCPKCLGELVEKIQEIQGEETRSRCEVTQLQEEGQNGRD